MNAPAVSLNVAERFHALRRRYLAVRSLITVAAVVAMLLIGWLVLSVVDYKWEWSASWRKSAILLVAMGVVMWLVRQVYRIVRDTRQRQFAAHLENEFDEFGQRIRTVLDTVDGKVSGPEQMLSALGHQTLGRWETLSPSKMIPNRAMLFAAGAAVIAIVSAIGMYMMGGDWSKAMRRGLGQQVAYTELAVTPGDARILEGDQMRVALDLIGRPNRDVAVRYRFLPLPEEVASDQTEDSSEPQSDADKEAEWIESELIPTESDEDASDTAENNEAHFALKIGKAKRPVEYQFVTSIGSTRVYRMDVQPLIEAKRVETTVVPPEYTRLEKRSFATSSVSVLEESDVSVVIETNHPLKSATLQTGRKLSQLTDVGIEAGDDKSSWQFKLPSSEALHWKFVGVGIDGTPMTPVIGRLRVRRDAPPRLTWQDPVDAIKVHTLAEVPMTVRVADDYGLVESGIVFELGGDDEYVLKSWPDAEADPTSKSEESPLTTRIQLSEILPLESFALSERDYISYYAYAIDNRASGQHRSESDVRYIDIRPLRQFYSEVELEPGQNVGGGGVLVQLDEIIRRERFLINRTRRLVRSSSNDLAKQLGTIDRMVVSQSELAGLVRLLADFFVSRGNDDVEALNQAEAAMLQAADSLSAGSFDLALVQEGDALRALAEARRTLEIVFAKNLTPQQRAALRRLSRQVRQRLRRERPKTEQQMADNLKRIASEQRQLGQSAMQLASNMQGNRQVGTGTGMGTGGKPQPNTENKDPKQSKSAAGSSGQPNENETEPKGSPDANADAKPADEPTDSEDPNDESGSNNEGSENEDSESNADGKGGGEDEDEPAEDEPTEKSDEEQIRELYAKQVDLLERLRAIEDELGERLTESALMAKRMEDAKASMDDLASAARDGELGKYSKGTEETVDQLNELGVHVEAVGATQTVARITSLRDMTSSMASMEQKLSRQLGDLNNESDDPGGMSRIQRTARQISNRSETVAEVMKIPVEVGDVEAGEVQDRLEEFIEENEFLDKLSASREAGEGLQNDKQKMEDSIGQADDALRRAAEYAGTAQMLDDLYQQLVTPRLNRLRKIEQRANQLNRRLSGGSGGQSQQNQNRPQKGMGNPQKPNPDAKNGGGSREEQDENQGGGGKSSDDDPEVKMGIRALMQELQAADLQELAEMLSETETTDKEIAERFEAAFGKQLGIGATRYGVGGRLALVIRDLQSRIQEMILLEISADRDAPVPVEYRDAVDGYFSVIAGDASADEKPAMNQTGANQ